MIINMNRSSTQKWNVYNHFSDIKVLGHRTVGGNQQRAKKQIIQWVSGESDTTKRPITLACKYFHTEGFDVDGLRALLSQLSSFYLTWDRRDTDFREKLEILVSVQLGRGFFLIIFQVFRQIFATGISFADGEN